MAASDKPCWLNDKLPPPVAVDYAVKGNWEEIGDLKTYVSGPQSSKKAILLVYDIFGVTPQVLQGADRLAEYLNALVVMPDFIKGNALNYDEYEKDPKNYIASKSSILAQYADIPTNVEVILNLMTQLKTRFPSVESWGGFGLCWGGKVVVLVSVAENNPFTASGQTHPGRLDAKDAEGLTIPHICMPSKDEPADMVSGYVKILTEKKLGKVELFETMFHGWMGARANLSDKEQLAGYQRGYAVAAEFFSEHL